MNISGQEAEFTTKDGMDWIKGQDTPSVGGLQLYLFSKGYDVKKSKSIAKGFKDIINMLNTINKKR